MSIMRISLVQMSMAAGILIIGIVLFRQLFVRRIPKRAMVVLWGIVVLRLFVPLCITRALPGIITLIIENTPHGDLAFGPITAVSTKFEAGNVEKIFYAADLQQRVNWSTILTAFYLAGAVVMCIGSIYLYFRDSRLLQESLPMEKPEKERLIRLMGETGMERKSLEKIDFRISDRTATPITCGIFRPAIVFPKGIWLKEEKEVEFCLLHEFVHIKNYDNLKKLVVHAAVCIHWFNPLVWVMYFLFNRDIELLCDETAVRRGMADRQGYALALLSLAERRTEGFRTALGFGKNAVKERVLAVMTAGRIKSSGVMASVLAVTAALTVFLGEQSIVITTVSDSFDTAEYAVTSDENMAISYVDNVAEYTITAADAEAFLEQTVTEEAGLSEDMMVSLKNLASEFEIYGLQVQALEDDYQFYFEGEPVYFLADNQNLDGDSFSGRVYAREASNRNGNTGVITQRDETGGIIGLVRLSEEESRDVAKMWTGKGR